MIIPWQGFQLSALLTKLGVQAGAKHVGFETLVRPEEMPGQQMGILDWPYVEGLRLDEAMHPLTLIATGLYGQPLPNQNGAPIRLVVPWKYGFKSIKSIVKIELTDVKPFSLWMNAAANEYGFYANVNPEVAQNKAVFPDEANLGLMVPPAALGNAARESMTAVYTSFKKGK